jgi:hypothetical protein
MAASRQERLQVFFAQLGAAPAAASFEEAYQQLTDVLNAVEDELTDVPYDPDSWQFDGRLYPPQMDSLREVPEHPEIKRFRAREHNVFISDWGAIEIRAVRGAIVLFAKPGADGRGVWPDDPD